MPVCNFLIEVPLTGVIIPIKQFFIHLLDSAAGFDFPVKNGDGILFKRTHGPARRVIYSSAAFLLLLPEGDSGSMSISCFMVALKFLTIVL